MNVHVIDSQGRVEGLPGQFTLDRHSRVLEQRSLLLVVGADRGMAGPRQVEPVVQPTVIEVGGGTLDQFLEPAASFLTMLIAE